MFDYYYCSILIAKNVTLDYYYYYCSVRILENVTLDYYYCSVDNLLVLFCSLLPTGSLVRGDNFTLPAAVVSGEHRSGRVACPAHHSVSGTP